MKVHKLKLNKLKKITAALLAVLMLAACSEGKPSSSAGDESSVSATESSVVSEAESSEISATWEASDAESQEAGELTLQEDFYGFINADWLETTTLPADKLAVGGFNDIAYEVFDLLRADYDRMLAEGSEEGQENIVALYKKGLDFEARAGSVLEDIQPVMDKAENLGSLTELNADWILDSMPTPFELAVMTDMKDAEHNALYAAAPSLFLPDKSYYETETGDLLLGTLAQVQAELLVMTGKTEEDAAKIAAEAAEFDKLLVPLSKSSEESSDYTAIYNPYSIEDFMAAVGDQVNFEGIITGLIGELPDKLIVTDPQFFDAFTSVVNEENFGIMKSWMTAVSVMGSADYLSEDFRQTAGAYNMILSGQQEMTSPEDSAFSQLQMIYYEPIGVYYGEKYFGREAKDDVISMIENLTAEYERSLMENDWLSEETKKKALLKLETMEVNVGYPDEINEMYAEFIVDGEKSYFENAMLFTRLSIASQYSKYGEPVNRGQWVMSGAEVNAMYSPMTNSITFPAAILQAPFYSIDQTAGQNYGGIGTVIAHEISHAFDPNGAKMDELGNLNDWWTEEDYKAFEERTAAVEKEFDGIEFAGGEVSGLLTVGENTADVGGLSTALAVAKELPDGDIEEFFTNYATIYRMKATPEYESLLLTVDVHAPNKLRVNVQVPNYSEFYDTFEINEGDAMYKAPEDRVTVW